MTNSIKPRVYLHSTVSISVPALRHGKSPEFDRKETPLATFSTATIIMTFTKEKDQFSTISSEPLSQNIVFRTTQRRQQPAFPSFYMYSVFARWCALYDVISNVTSLTATTHRPFRSNRHHRREPTHFYLQTNFSRGDGVADGWIAKLYFIIVVVAQLLSYSLPSIQP